MKISAYYPRVKIAVPNQPQPPDSSHDEEADGLCALVRLALRSEAHKPAGTDTAGYVLDSAQGHLKIRHVGEQAHDHLVKYKATLARHCFSAERDAKSEFITVFGMGQQVEQPSRACPECGQKHKSPSLVTTLTVDWEPNPNDSGGSGTRYFRCKRCKTILSEDISVGRQVASTTHEYAVFVRTRQDCSDLRDRLSKLRLGHGQSYVVKISALQDARTDTQNALYWTRVRAIARHTGDTPRKIHCHLVCEFLPDMAHLLNTPSVQITSALSTAEFIELIDRVDALCAELGVDASPRIPVALEHA